jgi:hypothetical protein
MLVRLGGVFGLVLYTSVGIYWFPTIVGAGDSGRSGRRREIGRASLDAHLRRDEAAPKMGHPDLWLGFGEQATAEAVSVETVQAILAGPKPSGSFDCGGKSAAFAQDDGFSWVP